MLLSEFYSSIKYHIMLRVTFAMSMRGMRLACRMEDHSEKIIHNCKVKKWHTPIKAKWATASCARPFCVETGMVTVYVWLGG